MLLLTLRSSRGKTKSQIVHSLRRSWETAFPKHFTLEVSGILLIAARETEAQRAKSILPKLAQPSISKGEHLSAAS